MEKTNITLIGMPASGKSTAGVLLAKSLGFAFVDTDLLLQQVSGMQLQALLAKEGIAGFKRREAEVICALHCSHTCIATGGSAVYSQKAMQYLQSISKVVFMDVPLKAITARLADISGRGVVMEDGKSLPELFQERRPIYQRYADLIVEIQPSWSLEMTVTEIVKQWRPS